MSLLRDIGDVRKYVTANNSTSMELLEPHVDLAQERYLKPLLGSIEFANLVSAYESNNLSLQQEALLPYAQRVVAQYMLLIALPTMMVHFSNIGVQEVQSKDGTTAGIRQWTFFELQGRTWLAADEAAEALLLFLAESPQGDFPAWESSAEFVRSRDLFISSAKELGEFVDARGSHRLYLALRPTMGQAERARVLPWICEDQFAELKAELLAGTASPANQALLERIRPVVAYHAILSWSRMSSVWLTPDGLRMPSMGNYSAGAPTKAADQELREAFRAEISTLAAAAETNLQKFIHTKIDDYPLIAASPCNPVHKSSQPYEPRDQTGMTSFMT